MLRELEKNTQIKTLNGYMMVSFIMFSMDLMKMDLTEMVMIYTDLIKMD